LDTYNICVELAECHTQMRRSADSCTNYRSRARRVRTTWKRGTDIVRFLAFPRFGHRAEPIARGRLDFIR
jgi:hypothetical protein